MNVSKGKQEFDKVGAETAYKAYANKLRWRGGDGDPMPDFADLPEDQKAAWKGAAESTAATALLFLLMDIKDEEQKG